MSFKFNAIDQMDNITKSKIHTVESLAPVLEQLKKEGNNIVFTNGCFDLMHIGHTRYLRSARAAGDKLVIAVNSDASVQTLKGPTRPVISLEQRMELLAGFYFVDFVLPFEELDPYNTIAALRPNTLIKGGDWPVEKIIGKDIVEENGGQVFTIPEIKGNSTTNIINRIITLNSEK